MTFGQRLRQRREALKLSREDLSAMSGVSHAQIARYEHETNQATAEAIASLARALRVSSDWLLGVTDVQGADALTMTERETLALLRTKFAERQQTILDILKLI